MSFTKYSARILGLCHLQYIPKAIPSCCMLFSEYESDIHRQKFRSWSSGMWHYIVTSLHGIITKRSLP